MVRYHQTQPTRPESRGVRSAATSLHSYRTDTREAGWRSASCSQAYPSYARAPALPPICPRRVMQISIFSLHDPRSAVREARPVAAPVATTDALSDRACEHRGFRARARERSETLFDGLGQCGQSDGGWRAWWSGGEVGCRRVRFLAGPVRRWVGRRGCGGVGGWAVGIESRAWARATREEGRRGRLEHKTGWTMGAAS